MIISIIIKVLLINNIIVNAATTTMKMVVEESDIKVGDTINVKLSMEEFQDILGLTAVGGVIEYDSNVLELKNITSQNGWTNVEYNNQNGKFITTQNDPKGKGDILKISFLVKVLQSKISGKI